MKLIFFFVFICLSSVVYSQNYYYSLGQQIPFANDSSSIIVVVNDTSHYNGIVSNIASAFNVPTDSIVLAEERNCIMVNSPCFKTVPFVKIIDSISISNNDIKYVSYSKRGNNNERFWFTDEVLIKVAKNFSINDIIPLLSSYNYDAISNEYDDWYSVRCFAETDVLSIANTLYTSQYIDYSHPNFYSKNSVYTNDPLFNYQYYLKNTGQYISDCENTGDWGTNGIDINVVPAWNISLGTSNLRIAVIDDGVEAHEDLETSEGASRVLQGYTPGCLFTCDGRPRQNGKHGQCCAGIIAASHNNIGIAGIAPMCNIVPIRVINGGYELFSVKNIAKAIKKSWSEYECDILSNSWNPTTRIADNIIDAYEGASIYGRNNKGCIIVAASGNESSNASPYSQILPSSAIIVGAVTNQGIRATYSNYGNFLSVVAPSNKAGYYNVRTIDREGNNRGYDLNSSYTNCFSGTSASCPQVSGVAALMLSVNPNLTATQVKTIIEKSAQKKGAYTYGYYPTIHPNGTWNDQVGYGLVNAHAAVLEAYFYDYTINGNASVQSCSEPQYSLSSTNVPNGTTFYWETSDNLEIISAQGAPNITVRPIGYGAGWVRANLIRENDTVKKIKDIMVTSGYSTYYNNYATNGSMTLGMNSVIAGTFTITDGNTVTINSTTYCSPTARIIIRPGGKLVIDGGTLTNLCPGKMWNGIRVLGNKNQRQLANYQGTLEIKNGSVISKAKDAISTWDGSDYNKSGGIVKCTNSTFLNNGKCADFKEYTNHTATGSETSNVSYFTNCNFTVDDNNIFVAAGVTYSDMITMCGVNGIKIRGCHFSDSRTGFPILGNAISLASAGVIIKPSCSFGDYTDLSPCQCIGENRNTFSGFAKGLNAQNAGTNYTFNVFKTDFALCDQGIYSSAVNSYKVTMSNFNLTGVDLLSPQDSYGIYSNNCSGYKIEANNLYTTNTSHVFCTTFGIHMQNSGSDANTIYRNTFEKLEKGVYLQNNPGLQVSCNEFSSNMTCDIISSGSIPNQGSSRESAGNQFSSGVTNFTSNIALYYYHSGANNSNNEYCPYNSTNVTKVPNITANECESTICIVPIFPPINPPINPKSVPVSDDITLYELLQQEYDSRLAEFNAAGYGFLLENFEEGDADIVDTARLMQDTLISIRRTMAEIANRNIDAILQDTLILDREALNGWYNRINTLTAKYSLVNSYFEMGEYALARQELAAIPQRFALTADKLDEHSNFCQYNSLRESVYTSERNYAQLTEDEIAELQTIAERSTGVSSAYANSVLCFFYGICRDEENYDDSDTDIDAPMNSKSTTAVAKSEAEQLAIYVYPNPADEELNILLNSLPEGRTTIEFHDVTGRLVLSEEIKSNNTSINISSLRQGVYMYRIVNGDNVIARDRIVKE